MHRKIRTKQESFSGLPFTLLFVLIWYTSLLKAILERPESLSGCLLFLAAGLIPLAVSFQQVRSVLYYRRLHRQYMQRPPKKGRIVSCQRQTCRTGTRRGTSIHYEYILLVELASDDSFQPVQISSEPYSWPVYRVLASPEVDIYTDETGWHHVLDGFHYKENRNDPGIFPESPYEKAPGLGNSGIVRFLVIAVMILMLLQVLRG